jgi:hypothetical protein
VLSCAASSTNVGPGRPAIRSMSAAGEVRGEGMETDTLDTAELTGGWADRTRKAAGRGRRAATWLFH